MNFLQTPYFFPPGTLKILFKAFTSVCNYFSRSILLEMSSHSSLIKTPHLILLYEKSWLLKWVIPSLESNPNTLLDYKFLLNVSFIEVYTLSGIYFPFRAVIGCKPPCSHKYCLLSIKNWLFFFVLDCSESKCSSGFIEIMDLIPSNLNQWYEFDSISHNHWLFFIVVSKYSFHNEILDWIVLHVFSINWASFLISSKSDFLSKICSVFLFLTSQ